MDKRAPRFAAGEMNLQGGTGGITAMVPCGKFLEVYKQDVTFRVQTPESIDPERTNPNAPWVATVSGHVGSSSPAVARVFLQSHEMLKVASFGGGVDKSEVVAHLHECKEALVACERFGNQIAEEIEKTTASVEATGIRRDNNGRGFNPFPHVPSLDAEVTGFLIHAKRAIERISTLPSLFLPLETADKNFDHLAPRLEKLGPDVQHVASFVRANAEGVAYLVRLRNHQEHPGKTRTIVHNFRITPDVKIMPPTWQLTGEPEYEIAPTVRQALDFLVLMGEMMTVHLVLARATSAFPYAIEEISGAEVNPACPIRYRLTLDTSRLRFREQDI